MNKNKKDYKIVYHLCCSGNATLRRDSDLLFVEIGSLFVENPLTFENVQVDYSADYTEESIVIASEVCFYSIENVWKALLKILCSKLFVIHLSEDEQQSFLDDKKDLESSSCLYYRKMKMNYIYTRVLSYYYSEAKKLSSPIVAMPNSVSVLYNFLFCYFSKGLKRMSLDYYAEQMNINKDDLTFEIQKATGKSPKNIIDMCTLCYAKSLLLQGIQSKEVSISLGFHDKSHFNRFFKKYAGITPSQYALDCTNI